jgi:hypothetical protein
VLARLCLVLIIFLSADSTLPNGMRVYEFTSIATSTNSFEVTVGYRTGGLQDVAGARGLGEVVAAFLKSTPSVRAIEIAAYGAGGTVEYFSDLDRTGIRLKMPNWARPMVENSIAEFLSETPQKNPELVDRALAEVRSHTTQESDLRAGVERQLRIALLGSYAQSDYSRVSRETVNEFFSKYYGTNRAFVVTNSAPLESLLSVESRISEDPKPKAEETQGSANRGQLPHVSSELDEGAVLLGVPTPSIFYRGWYALLMLDRLIRETVPSKPKTELFLSLQPYFYEMEVAVPSGQLSENVEAALREDLNQLQYVRATNEQLEASRRSTIQFLNSDRIQEWFASLGVSARRVEGLDWVRSFSADDMRAAARDLVNSNPVVASWSPRVRVLKLQTEYLSDIAARLAKSSTESAPALAALNPVKVVPFPAHTDAAFAEKKPERLDSGVSVVESTSYAVFVGPSSPNSLTFYAQEPDSTLLQTSYGAYRPGRILVMAPPESLQRLKRQWAQFKGNPNDETAPAVDGKIPGPHLPALFVLKTLLDRRLIEAGMWNDVQLEIRASEGSTLTIHASEADRSRVLSWIADIASRSIPDEELEWAREAAIHHLREFLPDLQSLTWAWTPDGTIFDFHFIPAALIKDAARMYLQ